MNKVGRSKSLTDNYFTIMNEQKWKKTIIMKLCQWEVPNCSVSLCVMRRIHKSFFLILCSETELYLHSCLLSKDGCILCFWTIIRKHPLVFSPRLGYKPSPIPDISTHFCQLPHWTGALRPGSLVTGPAGDVRVSSASTFLYLCTCGTGLEGAQVPSGAPDLNPS